MGFVLFTRNPGNQKLIVITDDGGEVAEFDNADAAMDVADNTTVCQAWGYGLIEVQV